MNKNKLKFYLFNFEFVNDTSNLKYKYFVHKVNIKFYVI